MPHFFINSKDIENKTILIKDKELLAHICLALRAKVGENVKFIDENEIQYFAKVEEISKKFLKATVEESFKSNRKLDFELVLVQSILKPDAQALLISNAVQTGVNAIYPIFSENCAPKLASVENKTEKWQKIANEAAKQCERANFARVMEISKFDEVLKNFMPKNVLVFAEKYAEFDFETGLNDVDKNSPIAVVVGPEGGFSEREFEYFRKSGFKLLTLGNLILKAPNAAVAGISNITSRLK